MIVIFARRVLKSQIFSHSLLILPRSLASLLVTVTVHIDCSASPANFVVVRSFQATPPPTKALSMSPLPNSFLNRTQKPQKYLDFGLKIRKAPPDADRFLEFSGDSGHRFC